MTYVVSTGPGGGFDAYGRLLSAYLEKHLGLQRVVVKNVSGGGHIVGANEIYSAPPDGLTIGTFSPGIIYAQLLNTDGLRADLDRMSWIGQPSEEPLLLTVSAKSGFRSIDDVRNAKRPVLFGASSVGSRVYYDAVLLAYALGLQTKMVFGLDTSGAHLSMMRGEIEVRLSSASSTRAFLADGHGRAIVRVGHGEEIDNGVPEAGDLVTTGDGAKAVDLVRSFTAFSHWTVGPPGIPDGRLEVLRGAYLDALSDPALVATARKMAIPVVPVRDGERLARDVRQALDQPPELVAFIASLTSRSGP